MADEKAQREITPDWVTNWLETIGENRQWLAAQMGGVSKRTIDTWYYQGKIPLIAQTLIRKIAEDHAVGRLRFSTDEWAKIQEAMFATGYKTIHDFITGAAIKLADESAQDSYGKKTPAADGEKKGGR
jgi:hypothetical protein